MADEIDHAALIGDVARRLWGEPNTRLSSKEELRFGTHGSRAVDLRKGTWYDHETSEGGGNIDLIKRETGHDGREAIKWLQAEGFIGKPANGSNGRLGAVVANYPYVDETGRLLFEVMRLEPKSFRQRRPDGHGGYLWNLKDTRRVLYRLPDLIAAVAAGKPIVIVEGERKADLLRTWDMPATCCSGGAGKWRAEYSTFLRGADVVVLPDNDDAGFEHVQKVGAALSGIAARVRVVLLPDLPPKGDIVNWSEAGGTADQLRTLIEAAPDWAPPVATDAPADADKAAAKAKEDAILEALSRHRPGVEFDRLRRQAAKELDVSRSAIDDEIDARRGELVVAPLYGHWAVDPWPEVVEGDSLLRDIIRRIRRHVVMTHDDALTIALWIVLAWVHDEVATHSPILNINSAEPISGKSTTLGLLAFLLPRCIASVDISEAALYRSIKKWSPTFAIDEFDSALVDDSKAGLVSVINSGHARGMGVIRCIGESRDPELFSTFSAKALGMIGRKLPGATLTRNIFVELRRKKKNEPVEKFKHEDDRELAELRQRLARWAVDNTDTLRTAEPAIPDDMDNRTADNWSLQFRIADLAGEDWGDQARSAALKIEGKADSRTIGVRLLADIKALFDADLKTHCLHSSFIVASLIEDPEKPWVEFTRGKPLTQGRLARMLGTYSITSQTVAPPGLKDGKGYYKAQFEDAWLRYLPAVPTDENLNFG